LLSVTVLAVGRLKDKFYDDAASEYLKRLSAYAKVQVQEVRAAELPEDPAPAQIEEALKKEGEALLKKLPAGAYPVALCIEGRQYTSEEFSRLLADAAVGGASHIAFFIGGSYGLSQEVKNRCKVKLSMSAMTFPHRLARVMLLEQLYRGFMIAEGGRYHK
jgi:23S rRNA (pseudouridine1915-N3)-methyltransferase